MGLVENIVANVVGGVLVGVLLEWFRSRRNAATVQTPEGTSVAAPRMAGGWAIGGSLWRIALALVIGFVLSAVVAGIIEAAVKQKDLIRFGEPAMIALMVFCTAFGWLALAAFSRR